MKFTHSATSNPSPNNLSLSTHKNMKKIVISKDKAIFWLDRNGYWHNEHGKFQHKKIIDYFHSCIRKDKNGFYLSQKRENYQEKVYFRYEDCALFIFDVIKDSDILLVLNTGRQMRLQPKKLFIKKDSLYMKQGEDTIKFAERALMKVSEFLECDNDRFFIKIKNRKYRIPKRPH